MAMAPPQRSAQQSFIVCVLVRPWPRCRCAAAAAACCREEARSAHRQRLESSRKPDK